MVDYYSEVLDFSPERFDRALDSARETLRKARSQFQNAAIATEHKELFGYCGKSGRGKEKKSRPSPWTKQFYCLAYCDQTRVPVGDDELDELYHAGLGMKKITIPDMNTVTNSHFRKMIIDNFPKLSHGGGFEFLRCAPNTKQLEVFSELAQTNPKVLQERSQKGKIFIRPVQSDLIGPPEKKLHVCYSIAYKHRIFLLSPFLNAKENRKQLPYCCTRR